MQWLSEIELIEENEIKIKNMAQLVVTRRSHVGTLAQPYLCPEYLMNEAKLM